jgi:hypothetical protein
MVSLGERSAAVGFVSHWIKNFNKYLIPNFH